MLSLLEDAASRDRADLTALARPMAICLNTKYHSDDNMSPACRRGINAHTETCYKDKIEEARNKVTRTNGIVLQQIISHPANPH